MLVTESGKNILTALYATVNMSNLRSNRFSKTTSGCICTHIALKNGGVLPSLRHSSQLKRLLSSFFLSLRFRDAVTDVECCYREQSWFREKMHCYGVHCMFCMILNTHDNYSAVLF